MKRILAFIVALVLVLSLTLTAYAVTPKLKIPAIPQIPKITKVEVVTHDKFWYDWFPVGLLRYWYR